MNIHQNRMARKWTRKELAGRVLWAACRPLFRYSPRLLWNWRCLLLRMFGAKIGAQVQIHPSARIFIPWNLQIGDWSSIGFDALIYNLGQITIGSRVTVSQRAHLCAGSHDFRDPAMTLLKPPIHIEDDVWISADTFVGPGVTIKQSAVVGACAVVVRNVGVGEVVGGNPSRVIGKR